MSSMALFQKSMISCTRRSENKYSSFHRPNSMVTVLPSGDLYGEASS